MEYTIIRSRRKTVAIYIKKDTSVEVRAPMMFPKSRIDAFVIQKRTWIEKTQNKLLLLQNSGDRILLTTEQIQKLIEAAKQTLPGKVDFYSRMMGVSPSSVRINSAKTHWASCSGRNRLNFSWRLMLASDATIDYVVVHELAHIREHNHSRQFWEIVERISPDHGTRKKELRELQDRIGYE